MPEDNENNEQQPAAKKSSKLKFILIGVVALILIIVILVVVYSLVLAPKGNEAAPQDQAAAQAQAQVAPVTQAPAPTAQQPMAPMPAMDMGMSTSTEIGQIYPIQTMNVNLADPTGITYLAITLALEFDPKNADLLAEIEAKMPRILDMIITVLSSKAYEEISTAQGKVNLRNEFLRRINAMMAKGKLYNVYITGFTVQR